MNTKLVHTKYPSHWYYPDGRPCYSVPMKSDPTKTRDTTLSDARKMHLYPSVTGIIQLMAKPQLESWKIEQAIYASLTLPQKKDEPLTDFAKRVVHDSTEQVKEAAKKGHLAHKCVEVYLATGKWEPAPEIEEMVSKTQTWLDQNITHVCYTEVSLAGDGYAGRCDLSAFVRGFDGRFILDYKTRKPSDGKIRAYDEDGIQLSAYADADTFLCIDPNDPVVNIGSIYINSVDVSEPTLCVWSKEDKERFSKAFYHLHKLWTLLKGYDPKTGESL